MSICHHDSRAKERLVIFPDLHPSSASLALRMGNLHGNVCRERKRPIVHENKTADMM